MNIESLRYFYLIAKEGEYQRCRKGSPHFPVRVKPARYKSWKAIYPKSCSSSEQQRGRTDEQRKNRL